MTRPGIGQAAHRVADTVPDRPSGVVSGTINGVGPIREHRAATLSLEAIERMVNEAVRYHERAVRDFRRVEGVAQPVQGGLGFHALHLVFHKWIEMAALSLERAAAALDDALFGLLRHLYCETAAGRGGPLDAARLRRTLEGLDALRQEISDQQQRLRQFVS